MSTSTSNWILNSRSLQAIAESLISNQEFKDTVTRILTSPLTSGPRARAPRQEGPISAAGSVPQAQEFLSANEESSYLFNRRGQSRVNVQQNRRNRRAVPLPVFSGSANRATLTCQTTRRKPPYMLKEVVLLDEKSIDTVIRPPKKAQLMDMGRVFQLNKFTAIKFYWCQIWIPQSELIFRPINHLSYRSQSSCQTWHKGRLIYSFATEKHHMRWYGHFSETPMGRAHPPPPEMSTCQIQKSGIFVHTNFIPIIVSFWVCLR